MTPANDKKILDELTLRFFNAFTNCKGSVPDVDCLYQIFIPEAKIVKNVDGVPVIYSLSEFLEPRKAILTDGTLIDFREEEISERTDIFGNIAQRFSSYTKTWVIDGQRFEGTGTKSIQFIRANGEWKIFALAWDDA